MENGFHASGRAAEQITGLGPVTRKMVMARTYELAALAGRVPPNVKQIDYERAKHELTGEAELNRQVAMLDAKPKPRPL